MKEVIVYFDVNAPIGRAFPGGMVVIGGNAPTWKFCNLFHKCVMEGAAVIATGPGIEISCDKKDYIVAYSIDMDYKIGESCRHNMMKPGEERDDLGDLPEF